MPFAVVLLLEPVTGQVVRALWRRLAEAGIRTMAELGVEPHVTLGVWDALDVVGAEPALDAFARETPPVPVSFVDVRPFGSTAVYLAPVATPLLRDAHARAHASFDALARGPSSHFTRDAWVPHCTLAMDLTRETSHAAWTVSQEARLPLEGRLERAALVEFRPARVHAVRLLTGR